MSKKPDRTSPNTPDEGRMEGSVERKVEESP